MSEEEKLIEEEIVSETEQRDEDLFNRDYNSIFELIVDCEKILLFMKQYAEGSSPEVLLAFVQDLMKKYDFEAKKIERRQKFQDSLTRKEEKVDNDSCKVKLNYRIKRKRYIIRRNKKLQKKMFRFFKKKILLKEIEKLNKKKNEVNEQKKDTKVLIENLKLETNQAKETIKQLGLPKNLS